MLNTKWYGLIQILNSKKVGKHFTRNELILLGVPLNQVSSTESNYFLALRHCGYFKTIKPGLYLKLKKIPPTLRQAEIMKQAYKKKRAR